jgi:hypothetical protein
VNSTHHSSAATPVPARVSHTRGSSRARSSAILRGILTKNPGVTTFTVERILESIGPDRFEASLMMFSIPSIVPISDASQVAPLPTVAVAGQLAIGRKQIRLPGLILRKTVSRRSLAVAIHAILPIIEAAERVVRPRWSWVTHPIARRVIGLFVFLLAAAMVYPLSGFGALHASSICAVALGMAEQDGLAVMIGLIAGALSLAIFAASGPSVRALRDLVRKVARKLGLKAFARYLERLGYRRLACVVRFEWPDVLLAWDPETHAAGRAHSGTAPPRPAPRGASASAYRGSERVSRARLRSAPATRLERSLAWRA